MEKGEQENTETSSVYSLLLDAVSFLSYVLHLSSLCCQQVFW